MRLTGLKHSLTESPLPALTDAVMVRVEGLEALGAGHLQQVLVPMTCAERRKVRRRLVAPDGQELGLALPTGTYLEPGSVLYANRSKVYVVAAAPEEVALIRVESWSQAARIAHAIGNLHRDIDPQPDGLLALWDGALELLLLRLGATFERTQRPFMGRPSWEHS